MHAEVRCRSTASEACTRAHCSYRARIIRILARSSARRLIFVMFGFNWFRCWAHKRIGSLRLVCTHMHTVIVNRHVLKIVHPIASGVHCTVHATAACARCTAYCNAS